MSTVIYKSPDKQKVDIAERRKNRKYNQSMIQNISDIEPTMPGLLDIGNILDAEAMTGEDLVRVEKERESLKQSQEANLGHLGNLSKLNVEQNVRMVQSSYIPPNQITNTNYT